MKKLLLVLAVVAMASFLFVGCLPGGTTPAEGEGEGEGEGEVEATIAIETEYTNAGGVTFVACKNADAETSVITVTLPTAVEVDYAVYVAVKEWVPAAGTVAGYYTYDKVLATPNAARTVWTVDDFPWAEADCEPICLVALVKHPCCPGEEVALKIVTVDCTAPKADLFVTLEDCADECDPDPCATAGVYLTWTSLTAATDCDPAVDCCGDACSGLASWTIEIEPDACAGPCDLVTGSCPVAGTLDCGCLPYADSGDVSITYDVKYTLLDNVGNEFTDVWTLTIGEDSGDTIKLVGEDASFTDKDGIIVGDDAFQVYDGGCE